MKNCSIKILILSLLTIIILSSNIYACTKFVYTSDKIVLTGRTTDWSDEVSTNIWSLPRGIKRNGLAGPNSLNWTSKYGSIVATVHNMMTIDGINEKGLTMSILRLKEILLDLNICHDEFWEYMRTRTKRVNYPLNSEMWGTFIDNKVGDSEQNIRILVPTLTSDFSYKINIHEYAHAYELFILLQEGKELANINIKESEEFAISKEDEYQLKKVL